LGSGVWGFEFRVSGYRAQVPDSQVRALIFGSWVQEFGFALTSFLSTRAAQGLKCRVSGLRFWISGLGLRVSGVRFRVSDFGFRVSSLGFRISGFESGLGFLTDLLHFNARGACGRELGEAPFRHRVLEDRV
jgi:hypothetical protein